MSYFFSSFRYTDAKSDKAYQIEMIDAGGGQWTVNYAFGKHGTSLQARHKFTGTKQQAERAYNALVDQRLKNQYQEVVSTDVPDAGGPRINVKGAPTPAAPAVDQPRAKAAPAKRPPQLQRAALALNAAPFAI